MFVNAPAYEARADVAQAVLETYPPAFFFQPDLHFDNRMVWVLKYIPELREYKLNSLNIEKQTKKLIILLCFTE